MSRSLTLIVARQIEQRATALTKALQYDRWAGTKVRRGGWMKGILLWPVEPTDAEIEGAAEFVGLALEAASIVSQDFGCTPAPASYGDNLSDPQKAYLKNVADTIASPQTEWLDPPLMTLIEAAKSAGGC